MLPGFLNEYTIGDVFDWIKVAVGILMITLVFFQKKLSSGIIAIAFFYFSFVFTSIIKLGNVVSAVKVFSNAIVFSIIISLGIANNIQVLNDVLTFNMFMLWTGELICLFLFPNGICRDNYYYNAYGFISIDNQLAPFVIISFFILMFNLLNGKKSLISIICLIEMFASVFITWSATCIVVAFILLAYIFLFYKKDIESFLDVKVLSLIVLALFFAIVFFRVQEIFSFFIEGFLGKSITLTGRTEIWDLAIYQIKQTVLFGRGFCAEHGWIFWHNKFFYSHNLFLEILLIGGVFSLTFFFIMVFVNFSKINPNKNRTLSALISICFFATGICNLTEGYMTSIYFPALFIIANSFNNLSNYNDMNYFMSSDQGEMNYE